MIKLFVTGDIHIGKKYDRYPEIKEKLIRGRFDCLRRCVLAAEEADCDFFVITGDLFDNTNAIRRSDINEAAEILSHFGGRVLVLPGNHDYYTGEEKVWKHFREALGSIEHNVTLITAFRDLRFDVREESITFSPAFCQAKHSTRNNLDWIRAREPDDATYHIGLAHGALAGLSPDMKNEYFLMTEKELLDIPMDAWLLGHTHIPYPADLSEETDAVGYRIFNPGTPEQTDLSNHTSGLCFVVTLDRTAGETTVSARACQSGAIRFHDLTVPVKDHDLKQSILSEINDLSANAVIRLRVKGAIPAEQFAEKQHIYEETLGGFLTYEVLDEELCELITTEQIRSEFAEIGFAAELLEALEDPKEIQMAYELIRKYRE